MKGNKNVSRLSFWSGGYTRSLSGTGQVIARADPLSNLSAILTRQGKRLGYKIYAARSIGELGRIRAEVEAFGRAVDMYARAFEAAVQTAKPENVSRIDYLETSRTKKAGDKMSSVGEKISSAVRGAADGGEEGLTRED
jgi:hypothetical protein